MGARRRFEVPEDRVVRGFRFEVEPTTPEQPGQIAQSFGGRRFAYSEPLGGSRPGPVSAAAVDARSLVQFITKLTRRPRHNRTGDPIHTVDARVVHVTAQYFT